MRRTAAFVTATALALLPAGAAAAQEPDPYTVVLPEDFSVEAIAEAVSEAVAEAIAEQVPPEVVVEVVSEAAGPGDITVEAPDVDVDVDAPTSATGEGGSGEGGSGEGGTGIGEGGTGTGGAASPEQIADVVAETVAGTAPSEEIADAIAEQVGGSISAEQIADEIAAAVGDQVNETLTEAAGGADGAGQDFEISAESLAPEGGVGAVPPAPDEDGMGAVPPVFGGPFPDEAGETSPQGEPSDGTEEVGVAQLPEQGEGAVPPAPGLTPDELADAITEALGEPLPAEQVDEVVADSVPTEAEETTAPEATGSSAPSEPQDVTAAQAGQTLPATGFGRTSSLLVLAVVLIGCGAGLVAATGRLVRGHRTPRRPS